MARNPVGRPTKMNEVVADKILNAVRAGNYIETAAAHAGITKETLYAWLRRAAAEQERVMKNPGAKIRKSEAPFVQFSDAVNKAFADAEIRDVTLIANAATSDWKAAAWRLERKFPDRWGRKDRIAAELEHKGNVGLNVVVSYGDEDGDGE